MLASLKKIRVIFFRELVVYFTTPPAYVFIIIFLLLTAFFTFASSPFGDLLNTNDTTISNSFFLYHPWLFLVIIPTIGMRLWSEERKNGTIELLFTMPVKLFEAVAGKYLAALFVTFAAILLTCPVPLTVNWLGIPDNYIILSGYFSSFLLAASYLALSSMFSAITKNQIVSFIVSFVVCLLLALVGHPAITDFFTEWAPVWLTNLMTNLSIFPHYEMMQKGIIDSKDILYFLSVILFGIIGTCLFLNSRSIVAYIKVFLILVVIINANFIICGYYSLRTDVTRDQLYTLSDGTKEVLKKLNATVTIRYYCTYKNNRLPVQLRSYASRISDLLQEYRAYSNGKIRVELFDPGPDSDEETSAIIDGIQGQMMKSGEKCYFGLTVSCMNRNQTIGFLSPQNEKTIEYDLTRAVYDVINPEKPVIGILSSLPVMGSYSGVVPMRSTKSVPWIFIQELQRLFEVESLDYNLQKIDSDIDVLIIVHPKMMSESTLFAIDQYLLNGGKLLVFVDPYCISDAILAMNKYYLKEQAKPGASSLPEFFKAWGIQFSGKDEVVMAPQNAYKSVESPLKKEHPGIIELKGAEALNQSNIVTANLNAINLIFPGAFTVASNKNLTFEVILKTAKYSGILADFNYQAPLTELMSRFTPEDKSALLGITLKGRFLTAFPDGDPLAVEKENRKPVKPDFLQHSKQESSVILIGDVDMLFNSFCVAKQQLYDKTILSSINSNLDFVMNAVDQLSGSQDIIEIRTRGTKRRTFDKFDKIFTAAKKKYSKQILLLEKQLQKTNEYIKEIQKKQENKTKLTLTSKQMNTIRKYRLEEKEIARKLRDVRKLLRDKVDKIKKKIELINIAAAPLLVLLIGLLIGFLKYRKCNK